MELSNIVSKLSRKYNGILDSTNHIYYSSLAYLAIKGLDAISTRLCVDNYGIEVEFGPIMRYAMETFGTNEGITITTALSAAAVLGIGYFSNKQCKSSKRRLVKNAPSLVIYAGTAVGLGLVVNNFINYFQ